MTSSRNWSSGPLLIILLCVTLAACSAPIKVERDWPQAVRSLAELERAIRPVEEEAFLTELSPDIAAKGKIRKRHCWDVTDVCCMWGIQVERCRP